MGGEDTKSSEARFTNVGHLRQFAINSDWKIFYTQLTQYFVVNNITDDKIQQALLINCCTEESYKLLENLCVPEDPTKKTFRELITLFDKHFVPPKLHFPERYKFYHAVRGRDEEIVEWASRIRHLASKCKFGAELQVVLRDRFIMGLGEGVILDRLLEEDVSNLTLQQSVDIAASKEASRHRYVLDSERSRKKEEAEMFQLSHQKSWRESQGQGRESKSLRRGNGRVTGKAEFGATSQLAAKSGSQLWCKVCGKKGHHVSKCRYQNYICHICGIRGHLAAVCSSSKKGGRSSHNFLSTEAEETMFRVQTNEVRYAPIQVEVEVGEDKLRFEFDSGASVSVISEKFWSEHFCNLALRSDGKWLSNYNGQKIVPLGYVEVEIKFKDLRHKLKLYVIRNGGPPLLGRDFYYKFNLEFLNKIESANNNNGSVAELLGQFPTVFSDQLGLFNRSTIRLNISEKAQPKFYKPRPLPFAIKDKVELELERLVKLGILQPVNFSHWGTPIVPIIKKDGTVRICADYKITANLAVEADLFPLPRIEEIFAKLKGETFTKLDLSRAYQQIGLDEQSREITTISTHKGLFQYTRLPCGLACAPSKFQRIMETILQGFDGVCCFLDDILITGKNFSQHVERVHAVLTRLQHCGLTIEFSKCAFFQDRVTYLGYVIDKTGLHPCEDKVRDVKNTPRPQNVKQVKAFLGLVNYYNKFIPNNASLLHPLYELLKKDSQFVWSEHCERAFVQVKEILTSDRVLAHYDATLPIVLTTDASEHGVAAIISHVVNNVEYPIAFASRTLSCAQRKYSQLEKEALAIIFGVTKFHQYLFGHKFILQTDHKPLVTIFGPKRGLPVLAANRLQRWALILANYEYDIRFIKSMDNNADALSRLPVADEFTEPAADYTYFNYIFSNSDLPIDSACIASETVKDKALSKVLKYIQKGWPKRITKELKGYEQYKNNLTVEGNCILFGYRVVIPKALRHNILQELHRSHMGIVKTKSLARSYVWWPNMSTQIENFIANCPNCLKLREAPGLSKLMPWSIPDSVWERIHIDFLGPIFNKQILIVVDAYSKWTEAFVMTNISTQATINVLRSLFARFGFPKTIVSDNGRAFTSEEFENFLRVNGIRFKRSAPYHPATNGQAENSVKTVKRALYKCLKDDNLANFNLALNKFLLDYRNTVHCMTGQSPAMLMLGRNLRCRLDLLRPDTRAVDVCKAGLQQTWRKKQAQAVKHYKGKRSQQFHVNDTVLARDYRHAKPAWCAGSIVKVLGPRTYLVEITEGYVWKRHINQLLVNRALRNVQDKNVDIEDKNYVEDRKILLDCKIDQDVQDNQTELSKESSLVTKLRRRSQLKPPDRFRY
ncbi:uncharacterized protein K02A2.6-like [Zophobas morio]|uniref:uncharacterized protein K02A2.6-like n=1 Tax=Zophobas morio TaxID=2755281 RepID=UPI003082C967